jgi:hypothetical protein
MSRDATVERGPATPPRRSRAPNHGPPLYALVCSPRAGFAGLEPTQPITRARRRGPGGGPALPMPAFAIHRARTRGHVRRRRTNPAVAIKHPSASAVRPESAFRAREPARTAGAAGGRYHAVTADRRTVAELWRRPNDDVGRSVATDPVLAATNPTASKVVSPRGYQVGRRVLIGGGRGRTSGSRRLLRCGGGRRDRRVPSSLRFRSRRRWRG